MVCASGFVLLLFGFVFRLPVCVGLVYFDCVVWLACDCYFLLVFDCLVELCLDCF